LFSDKHPLYEQLSGTFYSKKQGPSTVKLPTRVGHLAGKVEKNESFLPHGSLVPPLEDINLTEVDDDRSFSVHYEMPHSDHVHKSMLLRGIKMPEKMLDGSEVSVIRSKARHTGRSFGGVPLQNHNGGQNGRGGRISYAADNDYSRSQGNDRSNPFAAHLDPNFRPPPLGNQLATNGGHNQYQPPRQQQWADPRGGYRPQSYAQPPPLPPPQYNDRYNGSYNSGGGYQQTRGGYGSSYQDDRQDTRYQRNDGRPFNDGQNRGRGSYSQNGHNGGGYQGGYQGGRGGSENSNGYRR